MLKHSFSITLTLLLQIVAFGQARTVIVQPSRPIPVTPPIQPIRPPVQPVRPPGNQIGKWFYIATTEVRLSGERDVVNLTSRELFRAIKFNVTRNALEVYNLRAVFENGQSQDFPVRKIFQPGTGSQVLTFTGNYRIIKSIIFTYRTRGYLFSQRAHVIIYGLK